MSNNLTSAEQAAASVMSFMGQTSNDKREREQNYGDAAAGFMRPVKMARGNDGGRSTPTFEQPVAAVVPAAPKRAVRELKPYPFFFYRDHSEETDDDPLTPLTPPGRVPNFPAKMHAILGREDFRDIVAWLPHGRSWRVLKPREFEIKVIPMFFEHAKFSSFVRQANGWGFRRITQGKDRNSYYHEKFLRGMPHLCKTMKRPGVNEKKTADPEHEPDLYKISELHPVPEKTEDDSVLLHCTIQGGPKARMPIYLGPNMGSYTPGASLQTPMFGTAPPAMDQKPAAVQQQPPPAPQPAPQPVVYQQVQQQVQQQPGSPMNISPVASAPKSTFAAPATAPMPAFMALPTMQGQQTSPQSAAAAMANPFAAMMQHMPGMNPAAASQFAAGFAAATAFSQQHFAAMMENMAKQQQQQQAASQTTNH